MPVFLKKKKCKFLKFSKRKASSYEPHKTDGDAAATDDEATIESYMRIPVPENASIEERLAIFQQNDAAYNERMEKPLAEERQSLDELSISLQTLEVSSRKTQGYWQDMYKQSQENHEQFVNVVATQHKKTSPEFATLREKVVPEIELPIGGNQSNDLTGESQPYTEVVHREDGPQDCSSDNKIISEQILDFSTDQAKYVATNQMHGGQDAAHVHPLDYQKQMHNQFNYDFATGHHHVHAKSHGPPYYYTYI